MTSTTKVVERREAPSSTPSDLDSTSDKEVTDALNALLADVFTLYIKTKTFQWHISATDFRDYRLLLVEHGEQLIAITDDIAERIRTLGGTTIRSIGQIARLQRIPDNAAERVTTADMLRELRENENILVLAMRAAHAQCDNAGDRATASLLEYCIDDSLRRGWFLFQLTKA
jgi:starvation-inducible DNA-binding protein